MIKRIANDVGVFVLMKINSILRFALKQLRGW